jgi:hypothetical protein
MSDFEGKLRCGMIRFHREIDDVALARLLKEKDDEIETLRARLVQMRLSNGEESQRLLGRLGVKDAEIERLRSVLRMVKADRPTAHSDRVWAAINEALDEELYPPPSWPLENQRRYD